MRYFITITLILLVFEAICTPQDRQQLQHFLETRFAGLPWSECEQLGRDSVPKLTRVLQSGSDHSRGNAVVCLGILGDPRAVQPLRKFLEAGTTRLTVSQYLPKSSVLWALGAIANQSKDEDALKYLIAGLDESIWNERVHWTSPDQSSPSKPNLYLARASMQSLGIAASPQALDAIRNYSCKSEPCPLEDVKADALKTCREINELAKKRKHEGNPLRAFYSHNR